MVKFAMLFAAVLILSAGSAQSGEGRFKAVEKGVILDTTTGLHWTEDASTPTIGKCKGGAMIWDEAIAYVRCLNASSYLGHNDWRLPETKELISLIDYSQYRPAFPLGHLFKNLTGLSSHYWSASTNADGTGSSRSVVMWSGQVHYEGGSSGYAWPVRAGQ
ncbi:secreted protein containing DUF1566 [Candidatus Magnetoovum chiemensis]|nr:secreted protein containing DUF1566 [Candidatus Magnetoovum chiemensis]